MTTYTGGFLLIQYRKILELHFSGISQRTISSAVKAIHQKQKESIRTHGLVLALIFQQDISQPFVF